MDARFRGHDTGLGSTKMQNALGVALVAVGERAELVVAALTLSQAAWFQARPRGKWPLHPFVVAPQPGADQSDAVSLSSAG